jgi:hypothetical protein
LDAVGGVSLCPLLDHQTGLLQPSDRIPCKLWTKIQSKKTNPTQMWLAFRFLHLIYTKLWIPESNCGCYFNGIETQFLEILNPLT